MPFSKWYTHMLLPEAFDRQACPKPKGNGGIRSLSYVSLFSLFSVLFCFKFEEGSRLKRRSEFVKVETVSHTDDWLRPLTFYFNKSGCWNHPIVDLKLRTLSFHIYIEILIRAFANRDAVPEITCSRFKAHVWCTSRFWNTVSTLIFEVFVYVQTCSCNRIFESLNDRLQDSHISLAFIGEDINNVVLIPRYII
ncbi:hypothetical protein BDQ17DRAFT_1350490 [Cyathus striatus]|nr:hypothetical protein BDQ17DRAFT_1350490 [Cyathus striatus]